MMKKVKITVMKKARYDDLIEKYENPMEHECDVELGDTFIANGWEKPEDFCASAFMFKRIFILFNQVIIPCLFHHCNFHFLHSRTLY